MSKPFDNLLRLPHDRARADKLALQDPDRVRVKSKVAFKRMADSSKYGHWAIVWDRLISTLNSSTGDKVIDQALNYIKASDRFIYLYNGVLRSTTVPDKSRAIGILAKYVNEQLEDIAGGHPKVRADKLRRKMLTLESKLQKLGKVE